MIFPGDVRQLAASVVADIRPTLDMLADYDQMKEGRAVDVLPKPDCEGCHAPCCSRITLSDLRGYKELTPELQASWQGSGASLIVVEVVDQPWRHHLFDCTGLHSGKCMVYEKRPQPCRTYSCTEDPGRMQSDCPDSRVPWCYTNRDHGEGAA